MRHAARCEFASTLFLALFVAVGFTAVGAGVAGRQLVQVSGDCSSAAYRCVMALAGGRTGILTHCFPSLRGRSWLAGWMARSSAAQGHAGTTGRPVGHGAARSFGGGGFSSGGGFGGGGFGGGGFGGGCSGGGGASGGW